MKRKCPNCSSAEFVVPIRYGMPGPEMQKEYYDGKIKLGGCCQEMEAPKWNCKSCFYDWHPKYPDQGISYCGDCGEIKETCICDG